MVSFLLICIWSCVGCQKKEEWLVSFGNYGLNQKDLVVFAMDFAQEHSLNHTSELAMEYDDETSYEQYYQELFRKETLDVFLLYCKADQEKITLSKEQKKKVSEHVQDVVTYYGETWMEEHGVEESDVERVCKMKRLADVYIGEKNESTSSDDYESSRFVNIEQVLFVTTVLDDNGMIVMNEDGVTQTISDEQKRVAKQEAENFAKEAQEKKSLDVTGLSFETEVSESESYYKFDDLDNRYKDEMKHLKEGEVSNVIDTPYGYCVFKLLEKDAKNYAEVLKNYQKDAATKDHREEWISQLQHDVAKAGGIVENPDCFKNVNLMEYVVEYFE